MREPDSTGAADDGFTRPVLVLTRHPEDFADDFLAAGLEPHFAADMQQLQEILKAKAVSGFVLEVDQVFQAKGLEREHLFHLSEAFPLLRVRRSAQGPTAFIDDPESFLEQVRRFFPRRARLKPRAPVVLEALLAAADDPGFTAPSRAVILDISPSGGLLMGQGPLEPGGLVQLRIARLSDQAPITAGVCWQGEHGKGHSCVGVRFVEISPRQAEELESAAAGG